MHLSPQQIERYSRHVLLPDIGGTGRKRLLAATVVVAVGPGREAAVAALTYLAAAGVGHLLLGGDAAGALSAEEARLGIAYGARDAGSARVDALRRRLTALNPDVQVNVAPAELPGDVVRAPDLEAAGDVTSALERGAAMALDLLLAIARPS